MIFQKQINFFNSLDQVLFISLKKAINAYGFVLEENIANDQLYNRGVDSNEKPLVNKQTGNLGYAPTTIRRKIKKGQPINRVTLRDEYRFHPGITIKAYDTYMEIYSNVEHAKYLIINYGENIIKPTAENLKKFLIEYFLPKAKQDVGKKFN